VIGGGGGAGAGHGDRCGVRGAGRAAVVPVLERESITKWLDSIYSRRIVSARVY
jgi:hypothetical protein